MSVEYCAFQKCFADLTDAAVSGTLNPGQLAVKLYSKGLIGSELRTEAQKQAVEERVKIERLLSAVQGQIEVRSAKFFDFLGVLQEDPSLQDLATKLENTYLGVPLSLATYASYLKSVYEQAELPIYDKWPQVEFKKYVNLALIEKKEIAKQEVDQFTKTTIHGNIDDINKSKRAMNIGQIGQLPDWSKPKCILVEGAPGVGKSTFAWELCRKWGKGELLWQYQLVVLLRLRDKCVQTAKYISDLFRYQQHHIRQATVEEIQNTEGNGVFLLFDGYDELPEKLRSKNSIFLDVITGRELPEATVLITSRPWASEFLHRECKKRISQHVEILGFTKANIQSYLESTTGNDASLLAGLEEYVSYYPHIKSLMYIPLNSAIVVEVYRNSRKGETLVPKTMTELYSSLVRILLQCHLLDHPVHGKKICSFSDLSKNAPDVYQQLCELGRIAYDQGLISKGSVHEQQVIFSDLPEDFETLGLMQRVLELYAGEEAAISYNFLHLTVQEYLAAFHLSQQPVEKQIELYRKYCSGGDKQANHHLQMVLQFLSGIRKFSGYSSEVLDNLYVPHSDNSTTVIREVTFDTLHWLFEAHDKEVIEKVLGTSDVRLCVPYTHDKQYVVTPFDCFVLGYCVSHSNCTWRIDLKYGTDGCHIGDEGVEMLLLGAKEEITHCTGRISEIDLYNSDITSRHLLLLSSLLSKLEALYLGHNNLALGSFDAIADLIPHVPHLKKLHLSYVHKIVPGEAAPLIESLGSLEELKLHITGIGEEECRALSELLSSKSLLKFLNISFSINDEPHLSDPVEQIISKLCQNHTLKTLVMSFPHFSLRNTKSLAEVLRANRTLVHISLGRCNIDSDGACQLANALCTNETLQVFSLISNPTDVRGATAFAEMLKKNLTLVDLDLSQCNIDSDGACQLASALHTNRTLQILDLAKNPIGVKGADAFAELLLKNKALKELDLMDDSIGEEGAKKLMDFLTQNTTLESLYLPVRYESFVGSDVKSRVKFGDLV